MKISVLTILELIKTMEFEILPPSKSEVAKRCKEILHQETCNNAPADIVEIVNKTYPDIRKTLNLLQSCIVYDPAGTFLQLNKEIVNQKQYTDQIIDLIKSNDDKAFTPNSYCRWRRILHYSPKFNFINFRRIT